jgi:hypothetical protein
MSDLLFVRNYLNKDQDHPLAESLVGVSAFIGNGRIERSDTVIAGGVFVLHDSEGTLKKLGALKKEMVHLDDGTHSEAWIYLE